MEALLRAVENLDLFSLQFHPVFRGMPLDKLGLQIGMGVGRTVLTGQIHGFVPDLQRAAALENHIHGCEGEGLGVRIAPAQRDHARHPHQRVQLANRRGSQTLRPPGQQWVDIHEILPRTVFLGNLSPRPQWQG